MPFAVTFPVRHRRIRRVVGLASLFVALLVYRLGSANVTNDDFLHLSTAQQVVLGGVPVRDFLDPGELLFYSTSAIAQVLLGRTVFSEVLLDAVLLSAGHVTVFALAAHASRSLVVAAAATFFPVVAVERLYSYPKTFLYAVALALVWRYVDTRRLRVLLVLSCWTAVSFLFRHDHGAYIGITAAAMLALVHRGQVPVFVRRCLWFAVPLTLVLVPFLVFLEAHGGIAFYLRHTLDTARGEYARTVGRFPVFDLTWSGLLPRLTPPPAGEPDPNVTAWLYYTTVALPPLTVLVLAFDAWRRRRGHAPAWAGMDHEGLKLLCAALLGALMHWYLLRAKSDSAIADVSALTGVLGAWLLARAAVSGRDGLRRLVGGSSRPSHAGALAGVAAATLAAAAYGVTLYLLLQTAGGVGARRFVQAVAAGSDPLTERVERFRAMRAPFDGPGATYLFACTAETDRVLISSGYRPELYYAAGRGFAAGRVYFLNSLAPSPEFKAFSLERLRAERVPVALVDPEDHEFRDEFRGLSEYIQQHYRPAGQVEFSSVRFDVLVDTRLSPTGTWETADGNLPCFR